MAKSLQELMDQSPNFIEVLRNNRAGAYTFPVVPSEFSNWRDEQHAWLNAAVLLDLTYHMTYQYMKGPDIVRLLSHVGVNSFAGFQVDKAKQLICCAPSGHLIGDGIVFFLEEDHVLYAGRPIVANWVQYQAEAGGFDVEFVREARSPSRLMGRSTSRSLYRYQIQGPAAEKVIAKLNGGTFPEIRFFNMGYTNIGDRRVRALRHGMVGTKGLEIWGPYEEWEEVRSAILEAGEEFGIVPVGSRAYPTTTFESGWISSVLPAIYTGEELRPYRQWLKSDGYEANAPIGGSLVSPRFEDYYLTPYENGYGPFVKFDHDFIGRDALEKMDTASQRRKVTFEWNGDDVERVNGSLFKGRAEHHKYIDLPLSIYSSHDYDLVTIDGRAVGASMFAGYDYNHKYMLSLGIVGPEVENGREVKIIWGEPNGGSNKSTVEHHVQTEIRATVNVVPYSKVVRADYTSGWRTSVIA